ncbi:helix-turn-helix domain-containing protein [Dyadobacter psychrotolerans]|uniref:LuxR family transcriptional regulator n=1 Tax=Dyadobacter psychrotolerans TaxID=2541721 RepID=A0A4R5E2L7_9BACT|nr:helix-turn-helix transcriptional regulator [Dyadobacter psychrotolerans]TDE18655.1 LuxR family transcriptional regulator [Dyadobacter psychrotolerans]
MKKEYTRTIPPHQKLHTLSQTEHSVLFLVASGLNSKQISLELGVLPKSIDNYKNRIGKKLGIKGYKSLQCFAITNRDILLEWGRLLFPQLLTEHIPDVNFKKLTVTDMQETEGGNSYNLKDKFQLFKYNCSSKTLFGLAYFNSILLG